MFGFIKNLVKKSDNNFFLELKEEVEAKIDEAKKEIKELTETKDTKETNKVEAKQPNSNGAKPAPAVSAALVAVTPDTNGKTSPRKDAAAAKAAKIEAAKAAKEATTSAASSNPTDLVKKATAKKQEPVAPVEKNFATKYLMTPSSNGRRRPGANMNSYLEMARQVKSPNSNK
jgi:hypothetical protein